MFCACEIIRLFFVVICVVTAAHKFDFRLFLNEITNGDGWKEVHAVTETRSMCFPPIVVSSVKGHYPRCAGHLHSVH